MELVDNFDTSKAISSIYRSPGGRFLVEGHHTTIAATILRKSGPAMGQITKDAPAVLNVVWYKRPWEIWKRAIKVLP
jgi:hypothetical protein